MPINGTKVANTVGRGVARNERQSGKQGPFDVWTNTGEGISEGVTNLLNDPVGAVEAEIDGRKRQLGSMMQDDSSTIDEAADSFLANAENVGKAAEKLSKAKGPLEAFGAAFGTAVSLEQMLSVPFSIIPFPSFPAVRVSDQDVGLPHAHMHPPNLIPPAPPVPFPSTGPVIPIPFISGAATVLINKMPAGRCGDMGLGIFCGGFFPMYEIFLGSSNVWLEGARAARVGIDITKHCVFSTPKPQDPPVGPMIGSTVTSSPNVLIGGVPMPSLTAMAMGKGLKVMFKGVAKLKNVFKAADNMAEEVAEAVVKAADDVAEEAAEATAKAADDGVSRMADDFEEVTKVFRKQAQSTIDYSLENYQRALKQVENLEARGAIAIEGDAALTSAAKSDLIHIAMSKEGEMLLDDISIAHTQHGSSVHINAEVRQPNTDFDEFGPHCARPPGYGARAPDGTPGAPANSTVTYTPGIEGGGAKGTQHTPSDVVLAHELHHANTAQNGVSSGKIDATKPGYPNMEEEMAVATENAYRRERGLPERADYTDLP